MNSLLGYQKLCVAERRAVQESNELPLRGELSQMIWLTEKDPAFPSLLLLARDTRKEVCLAGGSFSHRGTDAHTQTHTDPHSRHISRVWTILDCAVILSDHLAPGSLPACAFCRLKIRLLFICSRRDHFFNSWAADAAAATAAAAFAASPDCCTHKVTQKAA